jgi:hypothetical protein
VILISEQIAIFRAADASAPVLQHATDARIKTI